MPKPKKPRRKPPQTLPRPARTGAASSASLAAISLIGSRDGQSEEQLGTWSDETVTGTVTEAGSDGVLLDVDGVTGYVPNFELPPLDRESPAQHYAVGNIVEAYPLGSLRDHSALVLSIRRARPEYANALAGFEGGDIVRGVVRFVADHLTIVDVDSVAGNIGAFYPPLAAGESLADRLSTDDHLDAIAGWAPLNDRSLDLLVVDDLSMYDAAFAVHQVGDVVKGYVTRVGAGIVALDINGIRGLVQPTELPPDLDVVVEYHYAEGDLVEALVVHVDVHRRMLLLSLRRMTPGYADAVAALEVGQSVSGTVIAIAPRTLWVDVDGLIGELDADEIPIEHGQMLSDLYAVGDAVEALIWITDARDRGFSLSVRRNSSSYAAQLATYQPGTIVRGIVTEQVGRWLDVNGVLGVLPRDVASDRQYTVGEAVETVVWQVDHDRRMLILAPRDLHGKVGEVAIVPGAKIDVVVQRNGPGGIRVLAENTTVFIPHYALSLVIGGRQQFDPDTVIRVVVTEVGDDGSPKALSHRRALDAWEQETNRFRPGTIVQDAQIIPLPALPESERRAAVDLGPISGFIPEDELDRNSAIELMEHLPNTRYPVMIKSLDDERGFAIVSHARFEERWSELAAEISLGMEVKAQLRRLDREIAFLDLRSGLTGEIPSEQISADGSADRLLTERIGEQIPVVVTGIDITNRRIDLEHRDHLLGRELANGESATLEFKSTLRVNLKSDDRRIDKRMEDEVLGTIAAFLNTEGGMLCIGVQDDGTALDAVKTDRFRDEDRMSLHLVNLVESRIGNSVWDDVKPSFESYRGKRILIVRCARSNQPVYVAGADGRKQFYIRRGPSSKPLEIDEATDYITRHFPM